jgi:hypothetical protein
MSHSNANKSMKQGLKKRLKNKHCTKKTLSFAGILLINCIFNGPGQYRLASTKDEKGNNKKSHRRRSAAFKEKQGGLSNRIKTRKCNLPDRIPWPR